jgi:hypothetical protein
VHVFIAPCDLVAAAPQATSDADALVRAAREEGAGAVARARAAADADAARAREEGERGVKAVRDEWDRCVRVRVCVRARVCVCVCV